MNQTLELRSLSRGLRIGKSGVRSIWCRVTLWVCDRALRLELPESTDLLARLEQARVVMLLDFGADFAQLHQ